VVVTASLLEPASFENRFYQEPWPESFRFFQLAFVVDDLLAAARRWVDVFGIGPFHILKPSVASVWYRGESLTVPMQVAASQAGPTQIELIEQKDNAPSVYRELYGPGAGGVHHIATVVKDFEAAKGFYERRGYERVMEILSAPMHVAYFDTRKDFGLYTEVIEADPTFVGYLTKIAQTCGAWDGKDPLRIPTRDGYRLPEV
jgi:hypothetical protein